MRRAIAVLGIVAAIGLVGAGCGDKTKVVSSTNSQGQTVTRTVPKVRFAKAKFVIHSALAFGAFKRYVYDPFKAGKFKSGANGRVAAIAKAVAATAFTANELRLARKAALSDDTLRGIGDKIGSLIPNVGDLGKLIKSGNIAQIAGISGGIAGIVALAKKAGVNIPTDKIPSIGG